MEEIVEVQKLINLNKIFIEELEINNISYDNMNSDEIIDFYILNIIEQYNLYLSKIKIKKYDNYINVISYYISMLASLSNEGQEFKDFKINYKPMHKNFFINKFFIERESKKIYNTLSQDLVKIRKFFPLRKRLGGVYIYDNKKDFNKHKDIITKIVIRDLKMLFDFYLIYLNNFNYFIKIFYNIYMETLSTSSRI